MVSVRFNAAAKNAEPSLVLLTKEQTASPALGFVRDSVFHQQITTLVREKRFAGDHGEIFPLLLKRGLTLIVGLGPKAKLSKTAFCMVVKQALESSYLRGISAVNIFPHSKDDEAILNIVDGILIGAYKWKKYLTPKKDAKALSAVTIAVPPKKIYADQIRICEGVRYARDLVNENADIVNSTFIEGEIRRLARQKKNIRLEVLGEKELKKKRLNLLLAVNKGSRNPARLLIAKYQGAGKGADYTALVGKGITFDTGGLDLKTVGHIETMRTDMSGAAAVLAVLKNTISLKIKKNVVFAVAIAENAIGSGAYKPGDVLKSYDGKTVEVANTDAEGRLVMADALSYVVKNYNPARVIDIATLTGACAIALGPDYAGLLSNDDQLAEKLLSLSPKTDDRLWRLPLYCELTRCLRSQYADLKNMGLPKGVGGTLTGAEFLRQFIGKTPWAHLDIAGTTFAETPRLYYNYGATGIGVRILTEFLRTH